MVTDFAMFDFTHKVRLVRAVSDSTPPPGVYKSEVRYHHPMNRVNVSASITLVEKSKFFLYYLHKMLNDEYYYKRYMKK